jgi:prevent-host-death family protein
MRGFFMSVVDLSKDILSLTEFKRKTAECVEQMKESGRPMVLTVNGKAQLVVQDAESYQNILEMLDRAEAVAGIRRGLESVARGEPTKTSTQYVAEMRKEYKLQKGSGKQSHR